MGTTLTWFNPPPPPPPRIFTFGVIWRTKCMKTTPRQSVTWRCNYSHDQSNSCIEECVCVFEWLTFHFAHCLQVCLQHQRSHLEHILERTWKSDYLTYKLEPLLNDLAQTDVNMYQIWSNLLKTCRSYLHFYGCHFFGITQYLIVLPILLLYTV